MRVKKLEILGFKSFPHKTTIHFEPGVTAIVGPNGSGKTNIVDSIRWVLGEHNPRDIRAPRLEDVIFNGTDYKAPLSLAEVTLTIENAQGLLPISFAEVSITRRVYRSGESECFINQSPCRLRDIQELLRGTGLGGGTYAIIEQGHIDMVLSSRPEERRVVFEEASGIATYLVKRKETIRRLEEVEEHLVRISDIAGEVKRQVCALERQASRARKYKAQWEQLKSLELRLAADEIRQGSVRRGELERALKELCDRRENLERQKQKQISVLETCKSAVASCSEHLQDVRTQKLECASHIEQHTSQFALKKRWIEELEQSCQQLDRGQEQQQARRQLCDEQMAHLVGAEAEIGTQRESIKGQHERSQSEFAGLEENLRSILKECEAAKGELFEAASQASAQRNRLKDSTSQLQGLEARFARLDAQRSQITSKKDDVRSRHESALTELANARRHCEVVQERLQDSQQRLNAARQRRNLLAERFHQLREQLGSARAQASLLEGIWKRYEGFPESVKILMSHSIEGLIGPLVDLLQAAPGYEPVLEAALGPLAEAVVVRDRDVMARCRQVLTTQQMQGVRFLALSDCPVAMGEMETPVLQASVSGAVKQVVKTEPQYRRLVDWLLNDSWIVEDMQHLLRHSDIPRCRLVSTRGDRWDRRSWRFAETSSPAQSRFARRKRWEQAVAALQPLESEVSEVDAQAKAAEAEWQLLLSQQESTKGELTHLTPALERLSAQEAELAREIEQTDEAERSLDLEIQEVKARCNELREEIAEAERAVDEAQRRQRDTEAQLAKAQRVRETTEARRRQLTISMAQTETSWRSLTERTDALRVRRAELESDRVQLSRQLKEHERQRRETEERLQDLRHQLQDHKEQRIRLEDERIQLSVQVEQAQAALSREESRRDSALPHLLKAEQNISELAGEIQRLEQQRAERGFRRSRLTERLHELYQIDDATIEAEVKADAEPLTDEKLASFSEQIKTLRAKLEGMGPVNLGSVEEYDELKRRHEFLQTQQQDLIKARDDLKDSISQINRSARVQFREIFERIKQEFKHYFTRLFNGGQADLILIDESDVLESGIDIVARPPGKRLQSISLLSGGERALVATALLFALFKVRPSPFCILDEIDASLDEANVDRFARILEEFLALSQFILVTHNKKTITKADCLYGVTMQEPGISKILSAKLAKRNDEVASPPAVSQPFTDSLKAGG